MKLQCTTKVDYVCYASNVNSVITNYTQMSSVMKWPYFQAKNMTSLFLVHQRCVMQCTYYQCNSRYVFFQYSTSPKYPILWCLITMATVVSQMLQECLLVIVAP